MGPTRPLNEEEKTARKRREVLEKDATEIALEKAIFGDPAGFLSSLNDAAQAEDRALTRVHNVRDGEGYDAEDNEDEDMQEMADEELFFLDAGTSDLPEDIMEGLRTEQEETQEDSHRRKVLWHDSDDDRITVSLASNTRLRKLRDTEEDDIVTGTEYIRRLRRQYERLHPTPEWVKYARKKRRLSKEDDEDSDSDSDISIDTPSVKPLAEILRSTAPLTRTITTKPNEPSQRTLRFRPEVVDIQRLKDIASTGPSAIDTLQFHSTLPLVLTAGPSSTINLYHLSPTSQNPNPLLTSLHVKRTPISTALFAQAPTPSNITTNATPRDDSSNNTNIYITSRRRYFHTWSLQSGHLTRITRPTYQSTSLSTAANNHRAQALTRKSRKNHELPTCEHIVLSPDSRYLAIISNTGSSGGVVHLLRTATHQPLTQIRIDGLNGIAEVCFYRDSSGISIVGKNGEVSEYSIAEQRVVARWIDAGAVGTTTIALGGEINQPQNLYASGSLTSEEKESGSTPMGNDRYIAIGSVSGIVNIYDRSKIISHLFSSSSTSTNTSTNAAPSQPYRPDPIRTLDNLTTPISHLHFSSDATGQLLVMASRWKNNALRLVHLPSCTVYKNWPTDKTPLGRISSVALSDGGRYLAVGNEAGKVRLWEMRD